MSVFQNNALLLLIATLFGTSAGSAAAAAAAAMTEEMEAQWRLWPYFNESIRWHSDWIRWHAANASLKEHFHAFRDFEAGNSNGDGHHSTIQRNTYLYDDERGTVSDCRACGPWELDKANPETSSPYGVVHPSRPYMRTIMFPDRSAAWLMRELPRDRESIGPGAGFELFLGDGDFLRVSIGIVYDGTGRLSQVSAIREDSRDFGLFWSNTNDAAANATTGDLPLLTKHADRNEKETALNDFWSQPPKTTIHSDDDGTVTVHKVFLPGLDYIQQQIYQGSAVNGFNSLEEHEVFEITTDGIILACPSQLPTDEDDDDGTFEIAVGWKKDDGSFVSSIEAMYENFTMSELVYTTLRKTSDDISAAAARCNIWDTCYCGIFAAVAFIVAMTSFA